MAAPPDTSKINNKRKKGYLGEINKLIRCTYILIFQELPSFIEMYPLTLRLLETLKWVVWKTVKIQVK